LHGFTGSGQVFKRNIDGLSKKFHVIVLDLRDHGLSENPRAGYHVARLAMDLKNLIEHLQLPEGQVSAIGTSLGAAILW
jgi:pimeloyl-ACP methyl ester carboxylesterase